MNGSMAIPSRDQSRSQSYSHSHSHLHSHTTGPSTQNGNRNISSNGNNNNYDMNPSPLHLNESPSTPSTALLLKKEYPILIPYQIDFQTRTIGKHISLTKRFCVWRFGFAHIPSLVASKKGVANRGIEFEIKFIWSIASGKYELHVNNICISTSSSISSINHHNTSSSSNSFSSSSHNKFDQTFNIPQSILPGGHILHITLWNKIHLNLQQRQLKREDTQEQQLHQIYVMRLDGQKYSQFVNIYELGYPEMMAKYQHSRVFSSLKNSNSNVNTNFSANDQKQNSNNNDFNLNNNHEANETDTDSIVKGRQRYQPRVRSHTADNGIHQNMYATNKHDHIDHMNDNQALNTSASDDVDYYMLNNVSNSQWNRSNSNRNSRNTNATTSIRVKSKYVSTSATNSHTLCNSYNKNWRNNLDKQDFATNDNEEKEYIAKAKLHSFRDLRGDEQSYNHNVTPYEYFQYDYSHQQQSQQQASYGNFEASSIPTFAKPPKSSTIAKKSKMRVNSPSMNNNYNSFHQGMKGKNVNTNQNSTIDLLDDNIMHTNNTTRKLSPNPRSSSSISGKSLKPSIAIPTLIRSTSDITLDTMLRDIGKEKDMNKSNAYHINHHQYNADDNDGTMSVVTQKKYSHLDPTQMFLTQQKISFRLQNPPMYADSSAGDLMQPQPAVSSSSFFVNGQINNSSGLSNTTNQPMSTTQQQQWVQGQSQNLPQPQQQNPPPINPAYQQLNATNFAGRHMNFPAQQQHVQSSSVNNTTATTAATTANHYHHTQQPTASSMSNNSQFVPPPPAPPAPSWDALNNAFTATPTHQSHKEIDNPTF